MAARYLKQTIWAVIAIAVMVIGAGGAFAFSLGKYEKLKINGDTAVIAVDKLTDGKARFYKYADSGKDISFFVVKAADGSYKAAFDACDACYKSKKGYEQQGDKMNCKNCNQKFAINRLGPNATGGCNPGYIPSQVKDNNILIKIADIKSGLRYF